MTFDTLELSDHDGSPVELYLFQSDDLLFTWAYTTENESRTIGGRTYLPEAVSRSELKQNAGESGSERLTVNIPWDNPVAVLHVPYLPPRPIRLTIYRLQRLDVGVELVQAFTGYVASFSQRGTQAELSCSQIIDSMQQSVPWAVFKPGCIWTTYEIGCGKNRADYLTVVNDLTAIGFKTLSSPTIDAQPDGWFTAGYVENSTTGEIRFITAHVGNMVTITYPFSGVTLASSLNFYAGDDHQPETCRLKFNNKVNYVGFDFFPNYNVFEKGTL